MAWLYPETFIMTGRERKTITGKRLLKHQIKNGVRAVEENCKKYVCHTAKSDSEAKLNIIFFNFRLLF
jgi:hypothetical protein